MYLIFLRFLLSLILTLAIEPVLAFVFRIRRKDLLLVILVNILTNPAAVLFSGLSGDKRAVQLLIEVPVILVEGCYYKKYGAAIKHPFLLSAAVNIVSYICGIIINCSF